MKIRMILAMATAACGVVILFAQQRSVGPDTQDQAKQGKQERQTPRGITVAEEVKSYVPVTDAMLRNPDPADWLMIRGRLLGQLLQQAESDHHTER